MTEIDAPVCAVETSARTIDRHDLPYRVNNAALATNPLHRYCADPNLAISTVDTFCTAPTTALMTGVPLHSACTFPTI
ncbi:hypothetical protein AB4920_00515 [Bifidobacterium dentium]